MWVSLEASIQLTFCLHNPYSDFHSYDINFSEIYCWLRMYLLCSIIKIYEGTRYLTENIFKGYQCISNKMLWKSMIFGVMSVKNKTFQYFYFSFMNFCCLLINSNHSKFQENHFKICKQLFHNRFNVLHSQSLGLSHENPSRNNFIHMNTKRRKKKSNLAAVVSLRKN